MSSHQRFDPRVVRTPVGSDPLHAEHLRSLVRSYVSLLKAEGLSPEKVVIAVKELATTAIAPHLPQQAREDTQQLTRDSIVDAAVRWCIHAYYEPAAPLPAASHAPPKLQLLRSDVSREARPDFTP